MKRDPRLRRPRSHPFWLPASTFYFLAAAIAIGVFFLVWAILNDGRDESPWITAGLLSSVWLIAAVVVREVVLRNRRNRIFAAQRRLDNSLRSVPTPIKSDTDPDKLTLERNSLLLEEIKRKSEAANVFGRLSESHREVFILCEAYIDAAHRELPYIRVGSPRLAAISRGREKAERLHRSHMLRWAELEAKNNTLEAAGSERAAVRLEKAKKALNAVDTALTHYPKEKSLGDSKAVLEELVFSIKLSSSIERGERAEANGNVRRALEYFREAELLIRNNVDTTEMAEEIRLRLSDDIERLEKLRVSDRT
ncbi:MAG TPA: hypothetical protein VJL58_06090 [Pyrinomonadaceae bacterium]|nr:hypothetical protein [Pyrinomonadaceae bacterium]